MRKSALVSIVIPCYNQAHFLGEAIESARQQEYTPLEVIVVDDGSTDATAQIATSYDGVRLLRQTNLGLAAARNAGLAASKGKYVIFLDADDRLLSGAVEVGACHLDGHPDWAFVHGRFRYINSAGEIITLPVEETIIAEDYYEGLLQRNFIGMHGTVMYRREVLAVVGGFRSRLRSCEDYDLYLRICRHFPVGRHEQLVAEYRLHPASLSRNYARMLKTSVEVLRSQYPCVKWNDRYKKALRLGIKHWQELYGERLIEELRKKVRATGYKSLLSSFGDYLVLMRYYPQGFLSHGYRWMKCAIVRSWLNDSLA